MTDPRHDDADRPDGTDSEARLPGSEEAPEFRQDSTGIAWGFVAVLLLAILVAVFIVQNDEPMAVEFFWFDFEMSIWIVILAVVLVTMIADQVISLFYRRRKRRKILDQGEPG